MKPVGTCYTCRKLKTGNMHHPDGHIEVNVKVCLDRRCEPGLNTYWRAVT